MGRPLTNLRGSDNPTRRQWIGWSSGALAWPLIGRLANGQDYQTAGADIKLGVASYSFRKFSRTEAIRMTKALGTPYLNIKDFHLKLNSTADEIAAAKKQFADAGIILVGCGTVSFDKDDEADMRSKFEYARAVGFPLMVCAPTQVTLPKLEKYVREFDVKIAVHNHGPEDQHFPTPQSVLAAVKDMDPRCGLCMDIGHTSRTGANIIESISEAGPRLLDMHFKDLSNPLGKESQVPVGDGKLPIKGIFEQLIKIKYKGSVNLEYEVEPENPMPGMQKSFAYMRRVLAAAGAVKSA